MARNPDNPGVIAPPPLIFFAFLLVGWALDRWLDIPFPLLETDVRRGLAVFLLVLGLAIEGWAGGVFRRAGTNVAPWSPSTTVVTDGPYRYSRNPMYVGFAVTYLGLAIGLESPTAAILLVPCLAVMHWGVIRREEAYLEAKFGQAYRDYKQRVRRWL